MNAPNITPDGIYDGTTLSAFGLPEATLRAARRQGLLRYTRLGNRIIYRGCWLTDWLDRSSVQDANAGGRDNA